MTNFFPEKRRYPRLETELPLRISIDDYDLATQTENISCIGAYCSINRYVRPLTKLSIILLLPSKRRNRNVTSKIQCKGVVVRTEQKSPRGYNIAIFFNEISQRDKQKIKEYVNQRIS